MISLTDPIARLHHIGAKTEPLFARMNIHSIKDLLWHLPQRYEDLSSIDNVVDVAPDKKNTVKVMVTKMSMRRSFRKKMMITEMHFMDNSGNGRAIWFHQPYIAKMFKKGDELYISGKVQKNLLETLFVNPEYEKVRERQIHTAQIVPYYTLTEGISHKQIRFLIQTALERAEPINDELPEDILKKEKFPPLAEALQHIHFPKIDENLQRAITRLKFEELFWLQLGVGYTKKFYKEKRAPELSYRKKALVDFEQILPFTLTDDQKKASEDILNDLEKTHPMNRLVQGDVGSGKTVVAATAILNAALNKYQSVLMAPTEVLAVQHFDELRKLLPNLTIALLTSKHSFIGAGKSDRVAIIDGLSHHTIDAIVGTHSLIQEGIEIKKAGLVIIDEQHRFGVGQRQRLANLGPEKTTPHLLSLTATPIPRTLALTLYGDLDISTIRQMPKGRKPIITKLVSEKNRQKAYEFIKKKIQSKQQAFVLCPLIHDNDETESKSVLAEYEHLRDGIFPDYEVRYLHGKLKADEKRTILSDFKKNAFPLLVTTSVIEVGIDIPGATIMVIEGAERFGLAQLHQFRGRVGRSDVQSYCLLFTESWSKQTHERLTMLCNTNDGFVLAEADLKMRGEGEVFGTRQSGLLNFKIATIHDTALIKKSRRWVDSIVEKDDTLEYYKTIKDKLRSVTSHRE